MAKNKNYPRSLNRKPKDKNCYVDNENSFKVFRYLASVRFATVKDIVKGVKLSRPVVDNYLKLQKNHKWIKTRPNIRDMRGVLWYVNTECEDPRQRKVLDEKWREQK